MRAESPSEKKVSDRPSMARPPPVGFTPSSKLLPCAPAALTELPASLVFPVTLFVRHAPAPSLPMPIIGDGVASFAKKSGVYLVLVVIAIVLAGAYGIVHDQITYTVSPEYYTKFKFLQFHLADSALPDRVRAGIVGFLASWWMGVYIGFRVSLQSFALVVGMTLAAGLAGLGYGYYRTQSIDLADYAFWMIPGDVIDLRRYLCVGYMHNASYLGGTLAIPAGWVFHLVVRFRARKR